MLTVQEITEADVRLDNGVTIDFDPVLARVLDHHRRRDAEYHAWGDGYEPSRMLDHGDGTSPRVGPRPFR